MINDADLTAILIVASLTTIPVTAIIGGYWQRVVKMTQQHREQMARIQALQGAPVDKKSRTELHAVQQELASLRDTTTQYDLSVERGMDTLLRRMEALESEVGPSAPAPVPALPGMAVQPQRDKLESPPDSYAAGGAEETPLRAGRAANEWAS